MLKQNLWAVMFHARFEPLTGQWKDMFSFRWSATVLYGAFMFRAMRKVLLVNWQTSSVLVLQRADGDNAAPCFTDVVSSLSEISQKYGETPEWHSHSLLSRRSAIPVRMLLSSALKILCISECRKFSLMSGASFWAAVKRSLSTIIILENTTWPSLFAGLSPSSPAFDQSLLVVEQQDNARGQEKPPKILHQIKIANMNLICNNGIRFQCCCPFPGLQLTRAYKGLPPCKTAFILYFVRRCCDLERAIIESIYLPGAQCRQWMYV